MKKIKGKTVFIIGGGPSASDVDFSLLQDELVICINDSYEDFPKATALYWVDESWIAEEYEHVRNANYPFIFTSKPTQHISYDIKPDPTGSCSTYILRRTGDFGYAPQVDCVMGNNSGVQVLNLIVNMKPQTIVLIGYDMKPRDRKTHYHNKFRLPTQGVIYDGLFIPSMNALHKGMQAHKTRPLIINANSDSAVRCFEFGDYTDFLTAK
jgi:hypothetical protein